MKSEVKVGDFVTGKRSGRHGGTRSVRGTVIAISEAKDSMTLDLFGEDGCLEVPIVDVIEEWRTVGDDSPRHYPRRTRRRAGMRTGKRDGPEIDDEVELG